MIHNIVFYGELFGRDILEDTKSNWKGSITKSFDIAENKHC
jgi:hypothetical protein